jgi:hypothetical protein
MEKEQGAHRMKLQEQMASAKAEQQKAQGRRTPEKKSK